MDSVFLDAVRTVIETKRAWVDATSAAYKIMCACGEFARRAEVLVRRQAKDMHVPAAEELLRGWVPRVADITPNLDCFCEPSVEFMDAEGKIIGSASWEYSGTDKYQRSCYCDDLALEKALSAFLDSWFDVDELTDLKSVL